MNDPIIARDRLFMAIFLSLIAHVIVIFGPLGGIPWAPATTEAPLTLELQLEPAAARELQLFADTVKSAADAASPENQPHQRHIDGTTEDGPAARYLRDWIMQAETIGNRNYPDTLRRERLSGRVVMAVTLTPQGEVVHTQFLGGNDHPTLRQAADALVRAASPYPAVPEAVLQGRDELVITRAWSFGER